MDMLISIPKMLEIFSVKLKKYDFLVSKFYKIMTIKTKCIAPYEQNKKLFMQLPDKPFHISSMKFNLSPPPNC